MGRGMPRDLVLRQQATWSPQLHLSELDFPPMAPRQPPDSLVFRRDGPCAQPPLSLVSFHRPIHQRRLVQAGEHAGELTARELAAHWHHHTAGQLPAATPAILPAQHQHGLPAQRALPVPGTTWPERLHTPAARGVADAQPRPRPRPVRLHTPARGVADA